MGLGMDFNNANFRDFFYQAGVRLEQQYDNDCIGWIVFARDLDTGSLLNKVFAEGQVLPDPKNGLRNYEVLNPVREALDAREQAVKDRAEAVEWWSGVEGAFT